MEPEDTLCSCFHVSKRKIQNYIRLHKPRRPSQVSECGGAGTGCGWCIPFLKRCFDQAQQTGELAVEPELTADEYARRRQQYLAEGKGKPPSGRNSSG
ncbi:MAG: bacterioferritin-associated ferredoxin [Planctomycetaceae bacterium]